LTFAFSQQPEAKNRAPELLLAENMADRDVDDQPGILLRYPVLFFFASHHLNRRHGFIVVLGSRWNALRA